MPKHALREPLAHIESLLVHANHDAGSNSFFPVLNAFFELCNTHDVGGELVKDPVLAGILACGVEQTLGRKPDGVVLQRIKGLGFVHGTALIPPYPVVFIWFDRRQQGLVAITDLGNGETYLLRVTNSGLPPSSAGPPD